MLATIRMLAFGVSFGALALGVGCGDRAPPPLWPEPPPPTLAEPIGQQADGSTSDDDDEPAADPAAPPTEDAEPAEEPDPEAGAVPIGARPSSSRGA